MKPASSPLEGPQAVPRQRRRWRRWLVLGVVVLILYLLRGQLLHGAARFLVDEDPPASPGFVLVLWPGPEVSEAIRLYREEQAEGVLVLTTPPKLSQRLGAVPPDDESAREALVRLGTASEKLQVLPSVGNTSWDHVRRLGEWLDRHPDGRVTFLCKRFQGRKWRYLLDKLLPAAEAGRVRLRPLPSPEYDETNWWHAKEGQLSFFDGVVAYAHVRLAGEGEAASPWDPDQYEKTLQPPVRTTLPPPHAGLVGSDGSSSLPLR